MTRLPVFFLIIFMLLAPQITYAQEIVVSGTCTLVDAILAANTDTARGGCVAGSGDDIIQLTANIALSEPADFTEGANGLPPITSTLTIEGNGFTISRQADSENFRLLMVLGDPSHGFAGNLTLNDVLLTGAEGHEGGAVYNFNGQLTVNRSTITDNVGGILFGTTGIYTYNGITSITESIFTDNPNFAVAACRDAQVVIDGTLFKDSFGAIYNCGDSEITIQRSGFVNNTLGPFKIEGGCIDNTGKMAISDTVFYENEKCILNHNSGELTIANSLFADNLRTVIKHDRSGTLNVSNTTFSYNGGSAIYSEGETNIANSTFYANNEGQEELGGLVNNGEKPFRVNNTIIADSFGMNCFSSTVYNIFEGANNLDSDRTCPNSQIVTGLDDTLADHGGITRTHALVESSNAINQANPALCPLTDQRGANRVEICDIGAFEFGGVVPPEQE